MREEPNIIENVITDSLDRDPIWRRLLSLIPAPVRGLIFWVVGSAASGLVWDLIKAAIGL